MEFHGCYAIAGSSKLVLFHFLQSVIQRWRMLKVVRWEGDLRDNDNTHDPQRRLMTSSHISILSLENSLRNFHEIWYGRYAIEDYSILVLFFPAASSTNVTWSNLWGGRMILRDDVITYDPPRWLVTSSSVLPSVSDRTNQSCCNLISGLASHGLFWNIMFPCNVRRKSILLELVNYWAFLVVK
jgi:hypothetical protein